MQLQSVMISTTTNKQKEQQQATQHHKQAINNNQQHAQRTGRIPPGKSSANHRSRGLQGLAKCPRTAEYFYGEILVEKKGRQKRRSCCWWLPINHSNNNCGCLSSYWCSNFFSTTNSFKMATWSWMSDNGWLVFDAAKTKVLETEYNKGNKKVGIDKERFVDLSLSHAEVCLHAHLDCYTDSQCIISLNSCADSQEFHQCNRQGAYRNSTQIWRLEQGIAPNNCVDLVV